MAETYASSGVKTLLLEIRNPEERFTEKLAAGVGVMMKTLGYDSSREQAEISPFKAVRDLEDMSKGRVEKLLLRLWHQIDKQWFGLEKATNLPKNVFILNNRIFLNPKTGRPLTKKEWIAIKEDILAAFDYIYSTEEERIALHALSLGRVLKGLPISDSIQFGYKAVANQVEDVLSKLYSPEWQNAVDFATQHAGELIVDLKQRQFKAIHDTIQSSIKNRVSTYELQDSLYERFGEMNRDWRRIAETEIGNSQNNGQLITELERHPEEDHVFMRGLSSPQACEWCRTKVNEQVVALLPAPPSGGGDTVEINGETYTAIWPGKDNYGRNRKNWWVAAGTQHPFCRCTWVAYTPGFDKWDAMFRTAMDQAWKRGKKLDKLPEDAESSEKPVPWKP